MYERSTKVRYFSETNDFEKNLSQDWALEPDQPSCKYSNNSFHGILTIGLIIGLPVSPCILYNSELGKTAKTWCYSLAAIKTILLIVTMVYLGQFFSTFSMRVTFYAYNVFGYIMMVVIFHKRTRLYSVLQDRVQLSSELRPGENVGGKGITHQIIAFVASVVSFAVSVVIFFFIEQKDSFQKVMYIPPNISDDAKDTFQLLVTASISIIVCISVCTCGFVVLLISNIYATIVLDTHSYGQRLQSQTRKSSQFSTRSILENLSTFAGLSNTVQSVDSAVSCYVFFLFCTLISAFFNTVTGLVSDGAGYRTASSWFYMAWIFVSAVGTLMLLCNCGSAITDEGEEVKRKAVQYVDQVLRVSTTKSISQVLSIFLDVIMRGRMEVTGGGMFVINNGLTLTIAGIMITYGMLILQMDRA